MPTKAELEAENAELKGQLAALNGRPPRDCELLCAHEVPYHGPQPCMADQDGDTSVMCICPLEAFEDHIEPEDA